MTIEQASQFFHVSMDKLELYEKQGLFDCHKQPDGHIEYTDELMDYISIINILTDAGAQVDTLRRFMQGMMQSTISKEEKLRYLRSQRQNLLNEIHAKQKSLDQLDYLIFDVNQTKSSKI